MSSTNGRFSSATDMWPTPQDFFDKLNAEFNFITDVCASVDNAKCPWYFTKEMDGLAQEWNGSCWMNPPYGKTIGDWVKKAYESSLKGATVVCLVPARVDTKWFHNYALKGEIRFIKGRLKFGKSDSNAPFASLLVIFRPPTGGSIQC
jgi:phage N-6-adenine-methyltransferase